MNVELIPETFNVELIPETFNVDFKVFLVSAIPTQYPATTLYPSLTLYPGG